nr:immunoglobulin light chain junction region [Macaca mulatta]
CYHYYSIPHGF